MKELQPGTHKANLTDWGMTATKAGDPQIFLKFAVDDGSPDLIDAFKYLSLKPAAKEFTYKALAACGFDGNDAGIAQGPSSNCLDMTAPVDVVCKMEDDGKGGVVCRIAFVNRQGEGGARRLTPEEVDAKVKFKFSEEMKNLGIEYGRKPGKTAEEIPF
jgi:hypothetical protein